MTQLLLLHAVVSLAASSLNSVDPVLNSSEASLPKDNFLEAAFSFVNPDPQTAPRAIFVYVPDTDTDARGIVQNSNVLAICKDCHAALVGCYFRGEGLEYDIPSGGSGRALDQAIAYFAHQTNNPNLTKVPLILYGYSQGAQFVFHYVCTRPQCVKAFAAIKPDHFQISPQEASFQVPGLLIAGENDESIRIRTAARAFSRAAGTSSHWTFLLEKNAGHESTRSSDFALDFLKAICIDAPNLTPVFMSIEERKPSSSSSPSSGLCWLPNKEIGVSWKLLHRPASLKEVMSLPDRLGLDQVINVTMHPLLYESQNNSSLMGTFDLVATQQEISVDRISITGPGFTLEGHDHGSLPLRLKVKFCPHGLDWGYVSANVAIEGRLNGHTTQPLNFRLPGMVKGPLVPFPSVVYFGVVEPGQEVSQDVVLKANTGAEKIASIKQPADIRVGVSAPEGQTNDIRLHIVWVAGARYGMMSDVIWLGFTTPQMGQLRIPIVGMIAKPK